MTLLLNYNNTLYKQLTISYKFFKKINLVFKLNTTGDFSALIFNHYRLVKFLYKMEYLRISCYNTVYMRLSSKSLLTMIFLSFYNYLHPSHEIDIFIKNEVKPMLVSPSRVKQQTLPIVINVHYIFLSSMHDIFATGR